jgi:hypothetical protein
MRTEDLVETLHRTALPGTAPDLERIARQGRRLVVRRRASAAAVALACAAAVAAPFALAQGGADERGTAAPAVGVSDDLAPAHPAGAVAETGDKFYWGKPHAASRGPEAVWVEAGDPPYRLSYGFREEAAGRLVRAGTLEVPSATGAGVDLPALPRQEEPTYVGMVAVPPGVAAGRLSAGVESLPPDVVTHVGHSLTVRPGYLVFWVTAGADLTRARWSVQDGAGTELAGGRFAPRPR